MAKDAAEAEAGSAPFAVECVHSLASTSLKST